MNPDIRDLSGLIWSGMERLPALQPEKTEGITDGMRIPESGRHTLPMEISLEPKLDGDYEIETPVMTQPPMEGVLTSKSLQPVKIEELTGGVQILGSGAQLPSMEIDSITNLLIDQVLMNPGPTPSHTHPEWPSTPGKLLQPVKMEGFTGGIKTSVQTTGSGEQPPLMDIDSGENPLVDKAGSGSTASGLRWPSTRTTRPQPAQMEWIADGNEITGSGGRLLSMEIHSDDSLLSNNFLVKTNPDSPPTEWPSTRMTLQQPAQIERMVDGTRVSASGVSGSGGLGVSAEVPGKPEPCTSPMYGVSIPSALPDWASAVYRLTEVARLAPLGEVTHSIQIGGSSGTPAPQEVRSEEEFIGGDEAPRGVRSEEEFIGGDEHKISEGNSTPPEVADIASRTREAAPSPESTCPSRPERQSSSEALTTKQIKEAMKISDLEEASTACTSLEALDSRPQSPHHEQRIGTNILGGTVWFPSRNTKSSSSREPIGRFGNELGGRVWHPPVEDPPFTLRPPDCDLNDSELLRRRLLRTKSKVDEQEDGPGDSSQRSPPSDRNPQTGPTQEEGDHDPSDPLQSMKGSSEATAGSSEASSCDTEVVPPPLPLYSDEVFNTYLEDLDRIYENIKLHDRLLKSLVRQVFDGGFNLSKFDDVAFAGNGYTRLFATLEENSADVKMLLAALENDLRLFSEKQRTLVKLITGVINPHTGRYWSNHKKADIKGMPVDEVNIGNTPFFG